MRLLIALTLPAICFTVGNRAANSADDPFVVGPLPAMTRAPAPAAAHFGLVLPTDAESTPTADDSSTTEDAPVPATAAPVPTPEYRVTSSSRDSYAATTELYPAPAHSLVPPPLVTGPRFRGAGNWTRAAVRGTHIRYPYYNYRSPRSYGGPGSVNHTIRW